MKTPDEIKKGLECCMAVQVGGPCPGECPLLDLCKSGDAGAVQREILALIQQLEAERDAAVGDLELLADCETCIHNDDEACAHCCDVTIRGNWQWRGVQKEE